MTSVISPPAILGNDKEKLRIQKDDPGFLANVISVLNSSRDPSQVRSAVTVVDAFVRLSQTYHVSLPVSEERLARDILMAAESHPAQLADTALSTVAQIFLGGSLPLLDATREDVGLIRALLGDRRSSSELVGEVCAVLVHLSPGRLDTIDTTSNLTPLQFYSALYRPILRRISYAGAPILANTGTVLTKEDANEASRELTPLLQTLAHFLPQLAKLEHKVKLPKLMLELLYSLLRAPNSSLSLAAATLLSEYTRSHLPPLDPQRQATYQRITPVLVALVEAAESNPAYKSGSHVSVSSPAVATFSFVASGFPAVRSPMAVLADVAHDYRPVCTELAATGFVERAAAIISETYVDPEVSPLPPQGVHRIADAMTFLSCVCAAEESNRDIVCSCSIRQALNTPLVCHRVLSLQFSQSLHAGTPLTAGELRVLRLSNELTSAVCYLLRAMARSASMLRTFLVEMDPVKHLNALIRVPLVQPGGSSGTDARLSALLYDFVEKEIVLRGIILGCIANMLVEFSAVKEEFTEDNDCGEAFYEVLKGYFSPEGEIQRSIAQIAPRGSTLLRVLALQVIRNSMYTDSPMFKRLFTQGDAVADIFALCEDPDDDVQQQCFNIIRNISVSSVQRSSQLYHAYSSFCSRHETFLQFLLRHLNSSQSPQTTEAINYILVHFGSSTLQNKMLFIECVPLLRKLLALLKAPIDPQLPADQQDALWKVKLSVIWIVTNLTWREDTSGSDGENEYEEEEEPEIAESSSSRDFTKTRARSARLIELGFDGPIRDISEHCHIPDLRERARTAIFQLLFQNPPQR